MELTSSAHVGEGPAFVKEVATLYDQGMTNVAMAKSLNTSLYRIEKAVAAIRINRPMDEQKVRRWRQKISKDQRASIFRLRAEGKLFDEIAMAVGVSITSIGRILAEPRAKGQPKRVVSQVKETVRLPPFQPPALVVDINHDPSLSSQCTQISALFLHLAEEAEEMAMAAKTLEAFEPMLEEVNRLRRLTEELSVKKQELERRLIENAMVVHSGR